MFYEICVQPFTSPSSLSIDVLQSRPKVIRARSSLSKMKKSFVVQAEQERPNEAADLELVVGLTSDLKGVRELTVVAMRKRAIGNAALPWWLRPDVRSSDR